MSTEIDTDEPQTDLSSFVASKSASSQAKPKPAQRTRANLNVREAQLIAVLDEYHLKATEGQPGGPVAFPFVPTYSQMEKIVASSAIAVDPSTQNWHLKLDTPGLNMAQNEAVVITLGQMRKDRNPDVAVPELEACLAKRAARLSPSEPIAPPVTQSATPAVYPAAVTSAQPAAPAATSSATPAVTAVAAPATAPEPNVDAVAAPAVAAAPVVAAVAQSGVQGPGSDPVETVAPHNTSTAPAAPAASASPTQSAADQAVDPTIAPVSDALKAGLVEVSTLTGPQRRFMRNLGIIRGQGVITCGDPIPEEMPEIRETHKERLTRLGIPPRPRIWPEMMLWPSARDMEFLDDPKVSADQRQKYVELLMKRQQDMLERAMVIDDYIRKHAGNAYMNNKKVISHLQENALDPFYGIKWAQLLDEKSATSVSNIVSSWGYDSLQTIDGGIVRVSNDAMTFGRTDRLLGAPTEQSIQLAMREGMARGWKSFKATGDKEFAMLAVKHARALNIECEITVLGAGWFRPKTIRIMPTPPVSEQQPAPSSTPKAAPAPSSPAPAAKAAPSPSGSAPSQAKAGPEATPSEAEGAGGRPGKPRRAPVVEDDPEINAFS